MGNFAQVIAEYRNSRGDIPYFNQVIEDLENTLLTNEYNSRAWGGTGVIKHADGNPQKRLGETMGNLIALQMLYPYFSEGNQTNFQNMLSPGWQGLLNSSLYHNGQFSFMDIDGNGTPGSYNDEASLLGAMTLFLYGVVPQTGSLAINASNERYQDYHTCFQTSQWQFNYTNHSIRLPIDKGNLTFIFGSQNVTGDFPEDGVYDIQFSSDWNSITSTTKIETITHPQLQPVTLQNIPKQPPPTTTPTITPTPMPTANLPASHELTPQPTISPTATPTPTPTPTPSEEPTRKPSETPQDNGSTQQSPFTLYTIIALTVSAAAFLSALAIRYVRGKRAV